MSKCEPCLRKGIAIRRRGTEFCGIICAKMYLLAPVFPEMRSLCFSFYKLFHFIRVILGSRGLKNLLCKIYICTGFCMGHNPIDILSLCLSSPHISVHCLTWKIGWYILSPQKNIGDKSPWINKVNSYTMHFSWVVASKSIS